MKNHRDIIRFIFAVIFLLGAIANVLILILNPQVYIGFADLSFIPLYRQLWTHFVIPDLFLFVGVTILFELIFAGLLLAGGMDARIGLAVAGIFMLFLFPFWWYGGGVVNLAFAVILFWLSSFSTPVSIKEWIDSRKIGKA
jgi:hypothetical protein